MKLLTILWFVAVCICIAASHKTNSNYCKLKCPMLNSLTSTMHLPGPTKRQFYKCDHGVGVLFNCPAKTEFNPKLQVCDWPKRAKAVACKGSPDARYEGSGNGRWQISYY